MSSQARLELLRASRSLASCWEPILGSVNSFLGLSSSCALRLLLRSRLLHLKYLSRYKTSDVIADDAVDPAASVTDDEEDALKEVWTSSDASLEEAWISSDVTLEESCTLSDASLEDAWTSSDTSLEEAWTSSDTSLEVACTSSDTLRMAEEACSMIPSDHVGEFPGDDCTASE